MSSTKNKIGYQEMMKQLFVQTLSDDQIDQLDLKNTAKWQVTGCQCPQLGCNEIVLIKGLHRKCLANHSHCLRYNDKFMIESKKLCNGCIYPKNNDIAYLTALEIKINASVLPPVPIELLWEKVMTDDRII